MKKDDKFILLLKDIMKTFLVSIVFLIILTQFFVRPFRVEGESMMPTLKNGEVGFSNIIGLKMGEISRFDVVIVYIEETDKYIVKRVIGLPGETVSYQDDILYINGHPVEESFLDSDFVRNYLYQGNDFFTADFNPIVLDDDQYFLMGDNRPRSSDSRTYGPFNYSQIKSKGAFVILPLTSFRNVGR